MSKFLSTLSDEDYHGFAKMVAGAIDNAIDNALAPLQSKIKTLEENVSRMVLHEARLHELENKPELKHRGVWRETESYRECSMVSHAGGLWIARADTKARPGQSHEWQLIVKAGKAPQS